MSPKGKGHLKLFFILNRVQMDTLQILATSTISLAMIGYRVYRLWIVRKLAEDDRNSVVSSHPVKGITIIKK